ncbi:MAG: PEP-CTERM sorting domain-containing protein [bacterium]
MQTAMIAGAGILMLAGAAMGQTITQWNFNSTTPDNNTATGTLTPRIGSGAASLVGGTRATFASAAGSSDPVTSDDSGWNIATFAAQGTNSGTRGVQFNISTLGFENLTFSWDQRHSNASARNVQFQYSIDGTNFQNFATFEANAGDTWFNGRTVDLSSIAAANNNANFAVRVVAVFAPGTSGYVSSNSPGTAYGTTGTWRFDMVTLSGTAIAVIPLPPAAMAGFGTLAMLAGFGALRRRRVSRA